MSWRGALSPFLPTHIPAGMSEQLFFREKKKSKLGHYLWAELGFWLFLIMTVVKDAG
jgi:hypothetical protein